MFHHAHQPMCEPRVVHVLSVAEFIPRLVALMASLSRGHLRSPAAGGSPRRHRAGVWNLWVLKAAPVVRKCQTKPILQAEIAASLRSSQ